MKNHILDTLALASLFAVIYIWAVFGYALLGNVQ
jgi:hypothetical protein